MCDDSFFSAETNVPCAPDSTTADYGAPGNVAKMNLWYTGPSMLGNGDTASFTTGRVPYYSSGPDYHSAYVEDCGYFESPLQQDGYYSSFESSHAASATYPARLLEEMNAVKPVAPCTAVTAQLQAAPTEGARSVRLCCKVCGDTASGNHFGVLSCEACKSFFRRSIRANARYACRWTRNCVVDRFTRNRCKYCRLEKCVLVGMKREAVQEDRLVLGYSLVSKVAPTKTSQAHIPPQFHTSVHRILSQTTLNFQARSYLAGQRDGISSDLVDSTSGCSTNNGPNMLSTMDEDPVTLCNRFPITMATLLNIVIEPKTKELKAMSRKIGVRDVVETLQQCFTKVLHWSAQIPSFTHLGLDDQVRLLKASWCEQCVLLFAVDNTVVPNTAFVLESYLCERDQVEDTMVVEVVDRIINDVTYWLNYLHVDDAELACLRALLLFNPGAKCLSPTARRAVEMFQEQTLSGLGAHITRGHGAASTRLAKLILQLGTVKAISHQMLQGMMVHQKHGTVTIGEAFSELMQFD